MARPASVATSNREDEYLGNPYTSFYTRTLLAGKAGCDGSWRGRKQELPHRLLLSFQSQIHPSCKLPWAPCSKRAQFSPLPSVLLSSLSSSYASVLTNRSLCSTCVSSSPFSTQQQKSAIPQAYVGALCFQELPTASYVAKKKVHTSYGLYGLSYLFLLLLSCSSCLSLSGHWAQQLFPHPRAFAHASCYLSCFPLHSFHHGLTPHPPYLG